MVNVNSDRRNTTLNEGEEMNEMDVKCGYAGRRKEMNGKGKGEREKRSAGEAVG